MSSPHIRGSWSQPGTLSLSRDENILWGSQTRARRAGTCAPRTFLHGVVETPIGGASHSAFRRDSTYPIGNWEQGTSCATTATPRNGVTRWDIPCLGTCHTLKGAAANNAIRTKNATRGQVAGGRRTRNAAPLRSGARECARSDSRHHCAQASGSNTGLISMIGVPSMASSDSTLIQCSVMLRIFVR